MGKASAVARLVHLMRGLRAPPESRGSAISDDVRAKWSRAVELAKVGGGGKHAEQAWVQVLHAFGFASSKLDTRGAVFATSCAATYGSARSKGAQ